MRRRALSSHRCRPRAVEKAPRVGLLSHSLAGAAIISLGLFPSGVLAHDASSDINTNILGSAGVVDMPSARMAPDGQLSVDGSFFKNTQHYNLGFQALPWLETSFRYSGLKDFSPNFPIYWDRSFAVKLRLWDEGDFAPAVAVGIDDVVGTGIYGAEYLVASKRFGSVDTTLGIGWGRLGTANTFKNPFGIFSKSFLRDRNSAGAAGATNFGALFHGPTAGVFGGVTWNTPLEGLNLSAEYSSDAYEKEAATPNFAPRTKLNVGASYKLLQNVGVGLGYIYGESLFASLSLSLDPTTTFEERIGPPKTAIHIRTAAEQQAAVDRVAGRSRAARSPMFSQASIVDALWSTVPIEDLQVRGRTLIIRVNNGDILALCGRAAAALSGRDLMVNTVSISHGAQTARCTVNNEVFVVNSSLDQDEGAVALHSLVLAASAGGSIDARDGKQPEQVSAVAEIKKELAIQKIQVIAFNISGTDAILYYSNPAYFRETDALDRSVRILMASAPSNVERFRIIAVINGVPQREFDFLRGPMERKMQDGNTYELLDQPDNNVPAPMQNPLFISAARKNYPSLDWSVYPSFRQQLFDPSNPFAVQLLGDAGATVRLLPGLSLQGSAEFNLYDNFNTLRGSDSVLPHVRTDFVRYFTEGKNGIANLDVEYRFRITPSVFAIARAGYLEDMFAGAGGEVLWRPDNERWALGIDGYEVQQRSFDRLFGLQSYRVWTGHVSLYYASPWYGLDFLMRAGQYLAGDRGITVQMTRRFESGVEVGAFFTRTNISSAQFGEGSFDKGIVIRIPVGWITPLNSQSEIGTILRPVQRDGGQTLAGDALLYEETRRTNRDELDRRIDK